MKVVKETDLELVQRCQQGDLSAFRDIVDRYKDKVYNTVFRMLGNPEEADDVLQEVFLRVYRSLDRFKSESSFSTWIYRIAVNQCMTAIRRSGTKKRKKPLSLDAAYGDEDRGGLEIAAETKAPDSGMMAREEVWQVQKAIGELPDEYRQILVLKEVEGFAYEEIARVMDCPVGTVRSRLFKAREMLRLKLLKHQ